MNYEYNMEAYKGPEVAVIAPGIYGGKTVTTTN